jgi:DNA uptake protein ComE-like DNA-binding protein
VSAKFSVRELRALLWLLPALAVVSWLVWEISRVKPDDPADTTPVSEEYPVISPQNTALPTEQEITAEEPSSPQLFTFDPNTVDYYDLVRLGFERGEALGIIKYRERGKVFEIPEDFAACYQVSEEMYRRLEPYIRIGEEFRLKKFERSGSSANPVSRRSGAEGNTLVSVSGIAPGATTEGGRAGIVQNVQPGSNAEEVRRVQPDHGNRPILVDLNAADSAALVSVSGIGALTASRIMEYRARLGGFADVRQLAEIRGMTEQNYERIIEQIYVDPAVIQKIDINFAPAKNLAAHPYIGAETLRKLLKQRQLKGGWRTPEELENDDIFTAEELMKLGPYLVFN